MNVEALLEAIMALPDGDRERLLTLMKARPTVRSQMEQVMTDARAAQVAEKLMLGGETGKPLVEKAVVDKSPAGNLRTHDALADYLIIFDGGSKGNPGLGYGSYQITAVRSGKSRVDRVTHGDNLTSNEAEYLTLIHVLQTLKDKVEQAGKNASEYSLDIRGDSQLVIFQVIGRWKAKDSRMAGYRDQVRSLLKAYKSYTLQHHDRSNSVKTLGH